MSKPLTNETLIRDFIIKFCNDHNGEVRFLRGIFYDEKDGAEEIIAFIRSALQAKQDDMVEKFKEMIGEDEQQVVGKVMDDFKYPTAKMKNLLRREIRAKLSNLSEK